MGGRPDCSRNNALSKVAQSAPIGGDNREFPKYNVAAVQGGLMKRSSGPANRSESIYEPLNSYALAAAGVEVPALSLLVE
jgi:hypothetical protein